jgi:hypothetical protein
MHRSLPLTTSMTKEKHASGYKSRSGNLLPPSPPAEKATARQEQAGQTSIGNRSRDRRVSLSRKSQFLG